MSTLEEVLARVQAHDRVCPQPQQWQRLYEMLPNRRRAGGGWEPPVPLILAAWWDTPPLLKMLRLREHIQWAHDHGCLGEVAAFLEALPEDQWHHVHD